MMPEADLSLLTSPRRRFFVREILGIFEAVLALLLFLALLSHASGDDWVGSVGAWVAGDLKFLFGRFVSYVVPIMLAADAWSVLLGRLPLAGKLRSWMRGLGAFLLLLAACGLLSLHVSLLSVGDPAAPGAAGSQASFEAGGLIGSFLIHPDGLNLPQFLGRPGGLVLFYGLAMVGLVLFTETLIRDLGRLVLGGLGALLRLLWWPLAGWVGPGLRRAIHIFRLESIREFMRGLEFRKASFAHRVLSPSPILDILPAPGDLDPEAGMDDGGDFSGADEAAGTDDYETNGAEKDEAIINGAARQPAQWDEDGGAMTLGAPDRASSVMGRKAAQRELDLFPQNYELPGLEMLADPPRTNYRMSEDEADRLSRRIEETLEQFKINVEVTEVVQGPVVTRFALHVAPGIRVSKILALENDMALALRAAQVRILAPIPGQAAVGIEVPNKRTNPVMLKELMSSEELKSAKSPLAFALGKNISGDPVIADLAKMPHVLIAGATGAGKSVCLNAIIASMLFRNPPDRVKFVMIDPKRVELSVYQGIPHLLAPVVSEPRKAAAALAWTVGQMESRYKLLAGVGVRNLDAYNALVKSSAAPPAQAGPNGSSSGGELKFLPRIVVVIDELADLMLVAKNEVEEYVIRLAQMARAVGIHLIVATQRPSVNVITGIIKANFPTRIAFRVTSKVDSRTILDMNGAQSLLGRGDMLFSPGGVKPFRIQGAFVSDAEIESLTDFIRSQQKANYEKEDFEELPTPAQRAKSQLMQSISPGAAGAVPDANGAGDSSLSDMAIPTAGRVAAVPLPPADMGGLTDEDLYDVALKLVLESRKASVSYIQRRLKIGYARAGRIMDMMEERGIVGPYQGSKPRDIIVDAEEFMERIDASDS